MTWSLFVKSSDESSVSHLICWRLSVKETFIAWKVVSSLRTEKPLKASNNDILCSAVSPYNTWSSWIPKMHIWRDLLKRASKNFSELPSPTLVYYVPCFICFIFCFENPRKNVSVDLQSFSSLPHPPPPPSPQPTSSPLRDPTHNSLCVTGDSYIQWSRARSGLPCCLILFFVFFWPPGAKFSLSPRREQSLRFAQCASSNILPYSRRLFQATRSTGTGLNEKDKILRALFKAANKSLASESSS